MNLVEQHIITPNSSSWKKLDNLCYLSKNLYNTSLYAIKKEYLLTGKTLRYPDLEKLFRNQHNPDYFNLLTACSQQILRKVDKNIKSFFELLKKYKKDKKSLTGCPEFPKYKDKLKGKYFNFFWF